MTSDFFDHPILNSPYAYPARHWELDAAGQPTGQVLERRRAAEYVTPVPKPKRQRSAAQPALPLGDLTGLATATQKYDPVPLINELRRRVDAWRGLPNPADWGVTPETTRLLQHWRGHPFGGLRPFFCQIEAVETLIWLSEVAPNTKEGKGFLEHLDNANQEANPELARLALKLATGAGKTTVMAMIIAWQTVNAVRRPTSKKWTRGFLIVTPGITIRDRLRVLLPNDPESYYRNRELLPNDMLPDIERAKIVITNYHAFKRRERLELAKGSRALLQGRGPALETVESEGQMIQRVMPDLMGLPRGRYNQIANFVLAQSEINIAIGDKAPAQYFCELVDQCNGGLKKYGGITDLPGLSANLQTSCLSESLLHGEIPEYDDFLGQRRRLMALKIKHWFDAL